jgi:serine/threonine protein kinase
VDKTSRITHPERLGKYQVTGVLGEGAMGVVYKGFDPGIQRAVALKTVRRQLLENDDHGPGMVARFRNEAQAAGRLAHPGIVAVYDYGDEGDVAYIAMEYVEGNTLERYIAEQVQFSDGDIISVVVQLLDALEHAHTQGVWHRDIKPSNILMTRDGRLKIADFGIARIESARLTLVNSIIGTPTYMAPEQFRGLEIDRRVDIYATGVLLYRLLVGRPPFIGSAESLSYRVVHEAPVLPSAVLGYERGAQYDPVLAVALSKDPAQRYATAQAFKFALISVIDIPVAATVSDQTVIAVSPRGPVQALGPSSGFDGSAASRPAASTGTAPTNWDPAVLAQVEASLARQVGPLASVLVRRTARDCADLPSLVQRLADQVTNGQARDAFLAQNLRHTTHRGTGSSPAQGSGVGSASGGAAVAAGRGVTPLSDAFIVQGARLLATHVGPIASVLAKRAAARGGGREAFVEALIEAVTDAAAREKLRAELSRLQ